MNVATAPLISRLGVTVVAVAPLIDCFTTKSAGTGGITVGALLNVTVTVPLTALTLAIVPIGEIVNALALLAVPPL